MNPSRLFLRSVLLLVPAALLALPLPAEGQPKPGPEVVNSIGMKLRRVPAGSITVQVTDEDFIIRPAATELEIDIKTPFHIGVHEVTQEQYEKVMGKNPSSFSAKGVNRHRVKGMDTFRFPAENITWHEAVEFCKRLGALEKEKAAKRTYRLPTSDEWEYCARAGSSARVLFAFGNSMSSKQANFDGNVPHGEAAKGPDLKRPEKVGGYAANAWGLYDMHGNVWEWCQDEFRGKGGKEDPLRKMVRGGSWINRARDCAASTRLAVLPEEQFNNIGFRVVCETGK